MKANDTYYTCRNDRELRRQYRKIYNAVYFYMTMLFHLVLCAIMIDCHEMQKRKLYIFTRIRFYDETSYFNTFRSSWNGNTFNGYSRYFSMRDTILLILATIKTDDPTMALCIRVIFSVLTSNFETILIILNRKPHWRHHNLSDHFLNYKILRHCWRWPKSITIGKYHNVRR